MPISRPRVFTDKNATYDDKFEDVMAYANAKISQLGTIKTIRSEKDLLAILQDLNNLEAKKGKEPRMSQEFVERIVATQAASKSKGLRLGAVAPSRFRESFHNFLSGRRASMGGERPSQETLGAGGMTEEELRRARAQRKDLYTYSGGTAVREVRGKSIIFRDARTGRFLPKNERYDEL